MTGRIVAVGALSAALLIAGLSALWIGATVIFGSPGPTSVLEEDLQAYAAQQAWIGMLSRAAGPFVGAGLVAAVGALALIVRRRSERRA